MLGHGVDFCGLGQRPVMNTADMFPYSTLGGGLMPQQTTPVSQTLFVFEFSLVGATRLAGGNYWTAGLDMGLGNKNVSHRNGRKMHTLYTFNT